MWPYKSEEDALVDVSLYGTDGTKIGDISTGFFPYTGTVQSISVNNLAQPKGIYLIRVKINDEIIVRKPGIHIYNIKV